MTAAKIKNNLFIIVMGVAGSGKSTIGRMLAAQLGCAFYDGDDFHPPANVAKMSAGIPLNDDDRAGWLAALANVARTGLARGESGVIACSALKQKYRDVLQVDPKRVKFIFLKGSYDFILERMHQRKDHFMKPEMLKSQFATLEEPRDAIIVDIALSPDEIVRRVLAELKKT